MNFESLPLAPELLRALADCGYTAPTPIQAQTIPALLQGQRRRRSAQTGTGKTAAFVLPACSGLSRQRPARSAVGTARGAGADPTRELAHQVAEAGARYGAMLRVKTVVLCGGVPYPAQNKRSRAASTSWSPRRAACSTTWSAAASTCRSSTCWCWTRRTGCSTWASSRTSSASPRARRPAPDGAVLGDAGRRDRPSRREAVARPGAHRGRRAARPRR